MFDINAIRDQFPILSRKIYGKDLLYFDNAATTQKPRCVVKKIEEGYLNVNANIHRGVHYLSMQATEAHEEARRAAQQFVNAQYAHEIIFTRGTTEGINLVASSFGDAFCSEGDEIIVTTMEHHSNIVPWQMLAERKGLTLKVAALLPDGRLNIEQLYSLFNERTKLLALTHVSNVLGTVNPIDSIIAEAHRRNIPVLVDGAQSVPHMDVDVQALDADFHLFSAHKVYGPTGIGVLYGKEKWLDKMPPYQGGGEMIAQVSFARTTYNELPYKFEAGTPDFIGSTALGEALRFVSGLGMETIARYEHELMAYAAERLSAIDGLRLYGPDLENRSGVASFLVRDIHHYDMGMLLDKMGIAVRTGHHCAQPLMQWLGVEGTVRASFALYNTKDEIDRLAQGIERVAKML